MMVMLFVATCLEQDLIPDSMSDGIDPNNILKSFTKPGHPVFEKLQALFGLSIHIASKTFRSLQELMLETGVDFDIEVYDSAFRYAESMKVVYTLQDIDEDKIRQVSVQADYIKHNKFLKYEETAYVELVSEINYLFNTCPATFVVAVNKEVEDNLTYLATIKEGVMHYNTYVTAQIIPFVVAYISKYGQVPYSVDFFKEFVREKIMENQKN